MYPEKFNVWTGTFGEFFIVVFFGRRILYRHMYRGILEKTIDTENREYTSLKRKYLLNKMEFLHNILSICGSHFPVARLEGLYWIATYVTSELFFVAASENKIYPRKPKTVEILFQRNIDDWKLITSESLQDFQQGFD